VTNINNFNVFFFLFASRPALNCPIRQAHFFYLISQKFEASQFFTFFCLSFFRTNFLGGGDGRGVRKVPKSVTYYLNGPRRPRCHVPSLASRLIWAELKTSTPTRSIAKILTDIKLKLQLQ